MTAHVRLAGQWSTVDQIYARVGGSWKEVAEGYVKIAGAWEQFFANAAPLVVDYLVIAGGGGGGNNRGGGGGGGGYLTNSVSLSVSTNYTVTVGAGGASSGTTNGAQGGDGSNSIFASFTAIGGGGGAGNLATGLVNGRNGGSGGGGGHLNGAGGTGTTGQGNAGGIGATIASGNSSAGGGGGAGQAGQDYQGTNGGDGGDGLASSITGTSIYRGGGGGGGAYNATGGTGGLGGGTDGTGNDTKPADASANTGGGGGGGGAINVPQAGGAGGSGVVILKYPDTYVLSASAGLSHRTDSITGYRITTFTAGTGTVSFSEAPTSDFELIETVVLTANQASVTFDVSGLGATYKHLQIRWTARNTAGSPDNIRMIFNGDSAANYSFHELYGNGTSVVSGASTSRSNMIVGIYAVSANIFGGGVIDCLDIFNTTKYKTIRCLDGYYDSSREIHLRSNSWRSTAAVTSFQLSPTANSFATGSRFSIYGLKG